MEGLKPTYPKQDTQEYRVLMRLIESDNEWISGQVFLRSMYLSQYHRAIWNLENRFHWNIEHSDFADEHGFKAYRLSNKPKQETLFEVPRIINLDKIFN